MIACHPDHQTNRWVCMQLKTELYCKLFFCLFVCLNVQFNDGVEAKFKNVSEQIINKYCRNYQRACVTPRSPM